MNKDIESIEQVNKLFNELESFFDGIFYNIRTFSIEEKIGYQSLIYEIIENIGNSFHEVFIEKFKIHLIDAFKLSIKRLKELPRNEDFTIKVSDDITRWEYSKQAIQLMFYQFSYALDAGSLETLETITNNTWKSEYLYVLNKELNLVDVLVNILNSHRNNETVSGVSAIKSILFLYRDVSSKQMSESYASFRDNIIRTSREYYTKTAEEYMEAGISIFLPKAKKFYEDELKRIDIGFENDIGEVLKKMLDDKFKIETLGYIDSNLETVFETDRDEDWKGLVTLFSESPRFDDVVLSVKKTMLKKFKDIFNNKFKENPAIEKDQLQICEILFSILENVKHKKEISFEKNEKLCNAVDASFKESIINNDLTEKNSKKDQIYPRALATYVGLLIRAKSKLETDPEKKKGKIAFVCEVLKYINGRDVFEIYYEKYFCERLIQGASESEDIEQFAIEELTKYCDRQSIHKLKRRYEEYQEKENISSAFEVYCTRDKVDIGFSVDPFIFSQSTGSTDRDIQVIKKPISDFKKYFDTFEKFYLKNKQRKVKFDHSLSHGVLQYLHLKKKLTLICTFIQMNILLFMNGKKSCTVQEIVEGLGILITDVIPPLSGIVSTGILKNSTGTSLTKDSVVTLDEKWKPRNMKTPIKKYDASFKEANEIKDDENAKKEIDESRKYVVEATQVRIMKQRRKLSYRELVNQTIELLSERFKVEIRLARRCIEELITKEYIRRDENDRETLHYIA